MKARADSVGLFWEDIETVKVKSELGAKKAAARNCPPPEIPRTGWKVKPFPRLDKATMIAIDTETKDPELIEHGPGWSRNRGHIVGISVAVPEGQSWYFPIRHEIGDNIPIEGVLAWARKELTRASQPKLFANASYDIGWLAEEKVLVAGPIIDVQLAEPLLDEYARSYALGTLGEKYLAANEGKLGNAVYQWCADAYGGKADRRSQGGNIYRAPAVVVGPYAERDASMLFGVWSIQEKLLREQGLWDIFDIERRLVPLLVAMRQRGICVDLKAAQDLDDDLTARIKIENRKLGGINVNAPTELIDYCNKAGIKFPKTAKDNPSFAGTWVEKNLPAVAECRRLMKARDTFIRGYIFGHHVNGVIHCQFNQMRSDDYGTVSGRFSSSTPNLQNIPARDDELAPLVRGLYIPDQGIKKWRRYDYSQIEFRLLTHYGVGRGANAARAQYNNDPSTDFHAMVADIVGLPRKPTKSINFGQVYGAGLDTLAAQVGRPKDEVEPMLETYHTKFPFVRATFDDATRRARRDGYITTILGRRARLPHHDDHRKALNRLLQGSAADIVKLAMLQLWEKGLCDEVGVPQLTVHDELDISDPDTKKSAAIFKEWRHIIEGCIKLQIPLLCSVEVGNDWGHLKELK